MKKVSQMPNPFNSNIKKTEWTVSAILMHWMRNIIEDKHLDVGLPDVETTGIDHARPDALIYTTRKSQDVLCVIEFKPPYFDPFDKELTEPAWEKARRRKAKYFVTSNFRELILWNTEKVNAQRPEEEQIVNKYHLSTIENLNFIENARYRNSINAGLENFLVDLYEIFTKRKVEPRLAIDEFLIWRLQEKIKRLAYYYKDIIYNQTQEDPRFAKELRKWFADQGWSFTWQDDDFNKIARQTAYLLVNKILFYSALQIKRPNELDKLEIPEDITQGGLLQSILEGYFKEVLKIDYETIYTTDFIDGVAFPDSREVVKEIKELVSILQRYDFSTLGFDIIGRIFEKLIPQEERHSLGQYFTNPDVVDLILRFCLKHEDDTVLDPSCGAGTFLVRAYQHKKIMNQNLKHEDILDSLWGTDIAKFPAHLATINLAINDLSVDKNYPNILQEDFFNLLTRQDGSWLPEKWRKARAKTLGQKEREVQYPRHFTCVVGNPPYTRQEEIGEILPESLTYKELLIKKALFDGSRQLADISKRAGIYVYFFIHGTKFLQNGGRFGFVVSNSWLDVEYGKGLQEFFLDNYKIVAIIESKIERWFKEADINTCIIILEKCSGRKKQKERNENFVRFVYLKKPLRYFIPAAQDIWEKQVKRLELIDNLTKTILAHHDFYENEDLRIFPKKQRELWEEGFDREGNKYIGSKWGKYIRAPEIFFKILKKGKDKLVPLKEIAQVKRGFTTGANEFFYLTETEIKRRKIEKEFWMHKDKKGNWVPNYVIKSPRECKSIVVKPEDLEYRVLIIHKDKKDLKGTNILRYIEWGERKGFHKRPTLASRKRWWDLEEVKGNILCMMSINERHIWWDNKDQCYIDARLYGTTIKDDRYKIHKYKILGCALNSTLFWLFTELWGRVNLGEGALDVKVYEYASMPVLKFDDRLKKLLQNKITQRKINNVFEELGAKNPEEVSLRKIKLDRRELDKIVMGEILGLSDEEQLEVYRAVIDLVKSRIEKAKSLGKRKKTKDGLNVEALTNTILEKIGENTLKKFYKEKVLNQKNLYTRKLFQLSEKPIIGKDLFAWHLASGKNVIECCSETEAHYLKVWLESGAKSIKVPEDKKYLEKITTELEKLKTDLDKIIEDYLSSILNIKVRNQILHQIWQKIIS